MTFKREQLALLHAMWELNFYDIFNIQEDNNDVKCHKRGTVNTMPGDNCKRCPSPPLSPFLAHPPTYFRGQGPSCSHDLVPSVFIRPLLTLTWESLPPDIPFYLNFYLFGKHSVCSPDFLVLRTEIISDWSGKPYGWDRAEVKAGALRASLSILWFIGSLTS